MVVKAMATKKARKMLKVMAKMPKMSPHLVSNFNEAKLFETSVVAVRN